LIEFDLSVEAVTEVHISPLIAENFGRRHLTEHSNRG
jgi:hypothetical protein